MLRPKFILTTALICFSGLAAGAEKLGESAQNSGKYFSPSIPNVDFLFSNPGPVPGVSIEFQKRLPCTNIHLLGFWIPNPVASTAPQI